MSSTRFGRRLRRLREQKGLTQAVLAKRAGVSRAYEARLEMGRHDPPLSRVQRFARALGVKTSTLVD
jgi:transcriptional regulator with XRE-family HTH domain